MMFSKVLILAAACVAIVAGAGHEVDCEGTEAMACAECICMVDQSCDEGVTETCLPMLAGCKLHLPFPAFTTVIATAIAL